MPLSSRLAWNRTIGELILLVALAAGVGVWIGYPWQLLCAALAGVVIWHYWRLRVILTRLRSRRRSAPSVGDGIWNEFDRMLYRGQTESRHTRKRLLQLLRAYRTAGAALPDALCIVDRHTKQLIWFNEASQPLLGLRYPDDVDRNVITTLPQLPISQLLSGPLDAEAIEVAAPNDASITLSMKLIPYADDLLMLVARDVSRLVTLEGMRRDFVANVSHELRTPLTVIHGYLDMLDCEDYPELSPVLTEMSRQSDRMTALVEDLLTLSRLEAQATVLEKERVNMAQMLSMLGRDAHGLSQGRHNILVENLTDIDLLGASNELHSAFLNLVSNAVRYTPTDGRIVIRFFRTGSGAAVLSVSDTGYGIPANHLKRLTERFYRVSNSRSRGTGGTGLGLAICKHILNLHGGYLEVSSEVGIGSTFSCYFERESVLESVAADNPLNSTEVSIEH